MTKPPVICDDCGQPLVLVSAYEQPVVPSFEPGPFVMRTYLCGCRHQRVLVTHGTLSKQINLFAEDAT